MFDYMKLKKYNGRKAVSPVVATLILIIVAIVGAVAVGLIVSGIGSSTSKNANANNAASNAQNIIYVGGSTTVFPVTSAGLQAFEQQTGISVQLSQGGSDAGMQGILSGALDVGESSSINAVNKLITNVQSNNVLTVNPVATLIGGSGVVFITTSTCAAVASPGLSCAPGSLGANPLNDGTHTCLALSRDAIAQMYLDGTFYITTGGCTGGTAAAPVANVLSNAAEVTTTNTGSGPFVAIARSDPGGTQDTACGYLNGAPVANGTGTLSYSTGQEGCGSAKAIGSGNFGVLQSVQACSASATGVTGVQGCIGFVDLGFADGASQQAAATCTGAKGQTPCNVFISEVSTGAAGAEAGAPASTEATLDPLLEATAAGATTASSYALSADSIGNIHSFIKTALKYGATENPATLTFPTTATPSFFPDATAGTAKGSAGALDRLLFLVTNGNAAGTPTGRFVTFFTQPSAEQYFAGAGYESQFDITAV